MGINKLTEWIRSICKQAFISEPNSFFKTSDNKNLFSGFHIAIDLLVFLYDSSISSRTAEEVFIQLKEKINKVLETFQPNLKSIFFCLDGVTPLAKLLKKKRNRNFYERFEFDVHQIVGGSTFLYKVQEWITQEYPIKKISKYDNNTKDIQYFFSSFEEPGEGEWKIFHYFNQILELTSKSNNESVSNEFKDAFIAFGNDSDMILLGIVSDIPNLFFKRESNSMVSVDFLKHYFQTIAKHNEFENLNQLLLDLVFMCVSSGTDYTVTLGTPISNRWDHYLNLKKEKGKSFQLIKQEKNNQNIEIKWENFCLLLAKWVSFELKQESIIDKPLTSEKTKIQIDYYFQALIWHTALVLEKVCFNYNFVYPFLEPPPPHFILIAFLQNNIPSSVQQPIPYHTSFFSTSSKVLSPFSLTLYTHIRIPEELQDSYIPQHFKQVLTGQEKEILKLIKTKKLTLENLTSIYKLIDTHRNK